MSLREYLVGKFFLLRAGDVVFDYFRNLDKETKNGGFVRKDISIERDIRTNPRVGFGFGRIRNLNPVIRAVRLDERLQAVGRDAPLARNQLLSAADQFTRYQGYQATYDRPEKYFWRDMNEATSSALSGVSPYDMMYLTDVLDEAIGSRLQGWEVIAGVSFNYDNRLTREQVDSLEAPQMLNRSFDIIKSINLFLRGRWFQNISLSHQIGIFSYINQQYPDDSTWKLWRTSIRVGANWLWNVADRWLLRTDVQNVYRREKRFYSFKRWRNRTSLGSNLSYFIENHLSINGAINARLEHRGTTLEALSSRDISMNFSVGMNYYFDRNLY